MVSVKAVLTTIKETGATAYFKNQDQLRLGLVLFSGGFGPFYKARGPKFYLYLRWKSKYLQSSGLKLFLPLREGEERRRVWVLWPGNFTCNVITDEYIKSVKKQSH